MQQVHFASLVSPVSTNQLINFQCLLTTAHAAGQYTEANVKMAEANQDFVMGFISMTPAKWAWGPGAPGIHCLLSGVHPEFTAQFQGYGFERSCNSGIMPDPGPLLVELCASDNASNVRLKELLQHRLCAASSD